MKAPALVFLAAATALVSCDRAEVSTSATRCADAAARSTTPSLVRNGAMVRIPAGCRNFREPGTDPTTGRESACTGSFWMDSVETSIANYRTIMGAGEAALHRADKDPCPDCPIDNLTYFEAILLANARTKSEMSPADTVYTYGAVVVSKTTNSLFKSVKPTEVTDLVGLAADTTRKGFRLPSRIEFAWAVLQNRIDSVGISDSADALVQWVASNSGGTTHPVGTLRHNDFGVHDGEGNVWEWTSALDSTNVGWTPPVWKYLHIALGGDYRDVPSATSDQRVPLHVQDEQHAGVRLVRNENPSSSSVVARPCR